MSSRNVSVYITNVLYTIIYQVGRIQIHRTGVLCIYHGFFIKWEDSRASRSLYQVGMIRLMVLGSYAYVQGSMYVTL